MSILALDDDVREIICQIGMHSFKTHNVQHLYCSESAKL